MSKKAIMLVDPITGELVNLDEKCTEAVSNYVLSRQAQNEEYVRKQKALERASGRHFIACTDKALLTITRELTQAEAGFLFKILPYLTGKDGEIKREGHYLLATDMEKIANRNRKSVSGYLNKFKRMGIVTEGVKVGRAKTYLFNKDMFTRSYAPDDYFTKLWINHARDISSKVKLEDLGLFLKMMPYMNTSNYTVSANPYELDEQSTHPLSLKVLSNILKYDLKSLTQSVRRLANADMVLTFNSGKQVCTALSPYFVSRMIEPGEDTLAAGIQALVSVASNMNRTV